MSRRQFLGSTIAAVVAAKMPGKQQTTSNPEGKKLIITAQWTKPDNTTVEHTRLIYYPKKYLFAKTPF